MSGASTPGARGRPAAEQQRYPEPPGRPHEGRSGLNQTRIDLAEPAFGWSCPSRKFPRKHSPGLFLLLVQQVATFGEGPPPARGAEWLAGRDKRAEKKARKADEPSARTRIDQASLNSFS